MAIALVLLLVSLLALTPAQAPRSDTADHCDTGETPTFSRGFGGLVEELGPIVGTPTTCEYPDPAGSGDVDQDTTTGLLFWRKSSDTPTFTNGYDHWALTPGGTTHWTGISIDPPSNAETARGDFSAFVGVWGGHGRVLEVLGAGEAFISYRTYRVCGQEPPPCDAISGNTIIDGGQIRLQLDSAAANTALGSIVTSADPKYPAATRAVFTLDANDALNVQLGDELFATFCGEASPAGYCGA